MRAWLHLCMHALITDNSMNTCPLKRFCLRLAVAVMSISPALAAQVSWVCTVEHRTPPFDNEGGGGVSFYSDTGKSLDERRPGDRAIIHWAVLSDTPEAVVATGGPFDRSIGGDDVSLVVVAINKRTGKFGSTMLYATAGKMVQSMGTCVRDPGH